MFSSTVLAAVPTGGTSTGDPLAGTLGCEGPGIGMLLLLALVIAAGWTTFSAEQCLPVGSECLLPHLLHCLGGFQELFILSTGVLRSERDVIVGILAQYYPNNN